MMENQMMKKNKIAIMKKNLNSSFPFGSSARSPISAAGAFQNGQIRPTFPLFDQSLLVDDEAAGPSQPAAHEPLKKFFTAEEADGTTEEIKSAVGLGQKSNSTGSSRVWRFRDLVHRSRSDGKDAFVFLKNLETESAKSRMAKLRKCNLRVLSVLLNRLVRFSDQNHAEPVLGGSTRLRYMGSTQSAVEHDKLYSVLHAVNLRPRMDPPLSARHFGNISRIAVTTPSRDIGDDGGYKIVNEVRNVLKQVDTEYVKKLQRSEAYLDVMKKRSETILKGEMVSFSFTSLCRFPIYEADFGWGKPVWVGSASLKFRNLIVFLDTKDGEGIEAWVNLKGEDMAKFEKDKELQAYASSDSEP